jgi:DNA-directed RNA polymerase subunit alpha
VWPPVRVFLFRRTTVELDLTGLQMPDPPEQPRQGRIVLRPLERGFGYTLGNTMRRILLSSLRGSAVWAFRADGVLHEHQTIPGVVEDVHQVIRNLKALVLRMDADTDEAILEIRADRSGRVTARSIRSHPSVQVMNPEHHILELQGDRDLRIELYVNTGRGFVLAEQHPIPRGTPADLVRIDAIYNPVVRANFVVEDTRVGQRTDFDRLVLEVETNGAIDVPGAVQYAARLAVEHLSYFAGAEVEWTWAWRMGGMAPLPGHPCLPASRKCSGNRSRKWARSAPGAATPFRSRTSTRWVIWCGVRSRKCSTSRTLERSRCRRPTNFSPLTASVLDWSSTAARTVRSAGVPTGLRKARTHPATA